MDSLKGVLGLTNVDDTIGEVEVEEDIWQVGEEVEVLECKYDITTNGSKESSRRMNTVDELERFKHKNVS